MDFRKLIVVLISVLGLSTSFAQTDNRLRYRIENKDTVYFDYIPQAVIYGPRKFKNQKDYREFYKLVYHLHKVYPYAIVARAKIAEYNNYYLTLNTRKERKAYATKIEKELFAEFEGPLRKLSITQGRILIRLIDRETGQTSYELIKELKGNFSAFFWQTTARLFGNNLKTRYDKNGQDKILEELVLMCENGTFEYLYLSMFGNKQ